MIILLSCLLLMISCAASKTKLSTKGLEVKILKHKPQKKCSVITKVVGENNQGSLELAQNHARNLVAKKDGNAIYFDEEVNNSKSYQVYSTGYICK